MFSTGYYGVPGNLRGSFTIHLITDEGPVCGWRPRREMEFQWCAHRIHYEMIECEKCKQRAKAILQETYRRTICSKVPRK